MKTSPRFIGVAVAMGSALLLAGCSASAALSAATESASASALKIGVVVQSEASLFDQIVGNFEKTVTAGLAPRKVTFDVQNAGGDQTLIASIARDMGSSDDDAFLALGTPVVVALSQSVGDRPVFAAAIGDPVGAGVARSLDKPGFNVSGSVGFVDPSIILDEVLKLQPGITSIGTIYDPSTQNLKVWSEALRAAVAKHKHLTLHEATISGAGDLGSAARSLTTGNDAILIGPDSTVIAGMSAVGAVMSGASVPLYTTGGDVKTPGVLAGIGPDYPKLGTLAGKVAITVLSGKSKVAEAPFAKPDGVSLQVNQSTKAALDINLDPTLLASATFVR